MSFDINALQAALENRHEVARVVIADLAGSSPRELGASMLVWADGQSGSIGGGALEHHAARAARAMLGGGRGRVFTRHALGPDLGQCCGGRVSLLSEIYDRNDLSGLSTEVVARPVTADGAAGMPLAVKRVLAEARSRGMRPAPRLIEGWMVEPVSRPTRPVWIWGAGHVGRALVGVLEPLPDLDLTWIDTAAARFPDTIPARVTAIPQAAPADLVRHAPATAEHVIVTYSHALDLELCHGLLTHGFAHAGLIGSASKWARFRARLAALGHAPAQIARITCPIGAPGLGKHPHVIAIGVAQDMLSRKSGTGSRKDRRA